MESVKTRSAFISYRHDEDGRDLNYACRIRKALDDLGWGSFLAPACISPGDDWRLRIVNFIQNSDVFMAVLTKKWPSSNWTKFELKLYEDVCRQQVRRFLAIAFEFEHVNELEHAEPVFYLKQKVVGAAELTHPALCWAIHASVAPVEVGLRSEWDANGKNLLRSLKATRSVSTIQSNWVALRDQLVVRYNSSSEIREIACALLGEVPPNLSEDPEVAWYQMIELAKNDELIERLRILTGLD